MLMCLHFFSILFFYIIQQNSTVISGLFRPRSTKYNNIRHVPCRMRYYFVKICIKRLANIILQSFSLNFAPRKLKNLQNMTNFAHEIYYILSNCEWKDCRMKHSTIFSCRIRLTPGLVNFLTKKLNARLLKN